MKMYENILIMTVGLPRSGKSTWAKKQNIPIVNCDSIRLALHGRAFIKEAEKMVWTIAKYMVIALFYAGHKKVILDATNFSQARRDEWVDGRWSCKYINFKTSKKVCLKRAEDNEDLKDIIDWMSEFIKFPTKDLYNRKRT